MNYTYLVCDFFVLIFGLWLTFNQIRTFRKKEQDQLGWDIKLLSAGIMAIMIGIYLIAHI